MGSTKSTKWLKERQCVGCKKLFIPAPYHLYRLRNKSTGKWDYYCCYTCYRKAGGDDGTQDKWRS